MSDVDGPSVEALAELKKVQNAVSVPTVDVQIQAVRIFHHEVRTAVGRDQCNELPSNRSQGQVGAVAVRGGPVCRPSRFRITGWRHSIKWSICCNQSGMHWRKSCK